MADDSVIAPDDLSALQELKDETVLAGIRRRFELKKIYTNINALLIAMNPYEALPIYSPEVMSQYKAAAPGSVPPHVYGTAAASFDGLRQRRSQSIVISGESGAGKSETAKKVLQFLAFAASRSGGDSNEGIEARILASSPPLEAFGNAKTSMNNNSSRYGKFLMLQFDPTGQLSTANIKTYLLEKTRVITQGAEERGYHIGYMLCGSADLKGKLGLPPAKDLAYLGSTGTLVSPGWDDQQELADCIRSFQKMGVPQEAVDMLWKTIAATLLLGQMDFGTGAEAAIMDKQGLEQLCSLIEVDAERLGFTLTVKRTRIGADTITKPNTPARAVELRNGLAKSIYSTCFDWLVIQINRSLRMGGDGGDDAADDVGQQFIGILDIFGFEKFDVNSLEQLCINFTNERLQSTFNEHVFNSVQEENAAEGVSLPEPDTSEIDNGAVVKLIGGKPAGILYSLNEECVVPKGNDQTFLDKLMAVHKNNPILSKPLGGGRKTKGPGDGGADPLLQAFTVKHFVGEVTYTAMGILDKNKDPKDEDLMVLLQRSGSEFVQTLFAATAETRQLVAKNKKDTRFQGVAAKFQKQLDELLRLIGYSHMHFIRCIKPNREKKPEIFVEPLVVTQLRCSGVFEAVRVIGLGYPDRIPHFQIVTQFSRLLPEAERPQIDDDGKLEMSEHDAVTQILTKLGLVAPKAAVAADPKATPPIAAEPAVEGDFALGHSKVFLKAGVLGLLRKKQQEQIVKKALQLQSYARGYIGRSHAMRLREERQRRLEEEAARALAEQMRLEEEARMAAEAAARIAAAEAATAKQKQEQEAAAADAAQRLGESKAVASAKVGDVERSRSFMLKGAVLGDGSSLAESRWRSVMKKPILRLKLGAITGLGNKMFSAAEVDARDETKRAQSLLTKRSQSRMQLLSAAEEEVAPPKKGMGLSLNLKKAGIGLPSSILSHRDGGGGVAPLMSARAPQRKDVKKTLARQKKDARWMEMVYEYAEYLGMDVSEDAELLWIAEQALRAPVPQGWEEKIDPFDDLYFFNETTYQSTRQHPMDAYYQQLYLKVRLQRKGGADVSEASMAPQMDVGAEESTGPGRKGKRKTIAPKNAPPSRLAERGTVAGAGGMTTRRMGRQSSIDPEGLTARQTSRGMLSSRSSRLLTARGEERHVVSSVSEALEMASPRSANFMLDRFGLTKESTEDERCLLINPAIWRVPAEGDEVPFIECIMDKEDLGLGLSRLSLFLCLNDGHEAFALGALKRMMNQNTMYELSMSESDDDIDVHYTGKLSCNARGNEFVIYDDSNDAVGIREGKARRELGVILIGQQQLGQALPIDLVIPRVQRDGQTAQFRPKTLSEAMIQQYKNGKTKHLFVLKGLVQLVPGGRVQLKFRGGDHSAVVFEAYRSTGDRWTIKYRHPLSAFQAFNVAIAVLHNQTTAMLDMLPPLDEVPQAPAQELTTELTHMETLQHAYGVVYCMCVYGNRVFCGTHSGHLQQWQCPIGSEPTVIEWRAHSGTIYAIMVAGRSLVSASRDWLLRVWDLQTLTLVATLPGHHGAVRCLAGSVAMPNIIFSGATDCTVRVWDVGSLQGGDSKKGQMLKGHRHWVRALVCSSDGDLLCSAARNIRVWSTSAPYECLHVIQVGTWVYCLAVSTLKQDVGLMERDMLYAGCSKGRVKFWKLSEVRNGNHTSGQVPSPFKRKVRALAVQDTVLVVGDNSGGVRAWDMSSNPPMGRALDAHTAGVRAIDVEKLTNMVFTAADDRCVRVWGEASLV